MFFSLVKSNLYRFKFRIGSFFVFFTVFLSQASLVKADTFGGCRVENRAVTKSVDFGTIKVKADGPVGSVIATQKTSQFLVTLFCTRPSYILYGKPVAPYNTQVSGMSSVFATNLKGIGVRSKLYINDLRQTSTVPYDIYNTINTNPINLDTNYPYGTVTVEL